MARYVEQELQPKIESERAVDLLALAGGLVRANWEVLVYGGLLLFTVVTRFWDLGSRSLHHDESLHALYSYYLYIGRGYQHDPMMHGPLQFHLNALFYFLFGVSDYTARILPAICGVALVMTPFFLRRFLGKYGALSTSALLAISPTIFYYSRFVRNDIYVAVFTMMMVIGMWKYLAERENRFLYLLTVGLVLSFSAKENTYITLVIFASFLALLGLRQLPSLPWRLIRRQSTSPSESLLILLVSLSLPLFTAGVKILEQPLGLDFSRPIYSVPGYTATNGTIVAAIAVLAFFAISIVIGLRWNGPIWVRCALFFWGVFFVLFTTVFTWLPGFATGVWGALAYWLDQHDVQRGAQPIYYYLALVPIYEFLSLAFAVGGGLFFALRRRTPFRLFLIYWSVLAFATYSIAGEKMPWLAVHLALPLILLAGSFIGYLIERTDWHRVRSLGALWLIPIVPLGFMAFLGFLNVFAETRANPTPPHLIQMLAMLAVVIAIIAIGSRIAGRLSAREQAYALLFGLLALLGLFTVRAAWEVNYYHGDIPVEMMVYTQTSPDVPRIMQQIDQIAQRTGEGKNLKITVDATESHTWPWAWYLRDYTNVDFPDLSTGTPPNSTVLILHASNEQRLKAYLARYGPGERYHLRWWFPEDYRDLSNQPLPQAIGSVVSEVTNPASLEAIWRYFVYRETLNPLGSSDGIVYFPKDFPLGVAAPPQSVVPDEFVTKQVEIPSAQTFGQKGTEPGQFNEPKNVAVDSAGNIYVADTQNNRIQKLDGNGRVIAATGQQGSGEGQFNEPWGIAVDRAGNVYVADTWNHRIQKFDSNLNFLASWGQELTDTQGQVDALLGSFYGPRDVAVAPDGTVLVTDTGNHRIQRFDADGRPLGVFGGLGSDRGQLREPVGIDVDQAGNIYVADTWNLRIQKFDSSFNHVAEIPIQQGWDSQSTVNKPYIAVAPNGDIVVSDPEYGRLFRFSAEGTLLAVINKFGSDAASFNLPIGVAFDSHGNLFVADTGNSRIERFDPFR